MVKLILLKIQTSFYELHSAKKAKRSWKSPLMLLNRFCLLSFSFCCSLSQQAVSPFAPSPFLSCCRRPWRRGEETCRGCSRCPRQWLYPADERMIKEGIKTSSKLIYWTGDISDLKKRFLVIFISIIENSLETKISNYLSYNYITWVVMRTRGVQTVQISSNLIKDNCISHLSSQSILKSFRYLFFFYAWLNALKGKWSKIVFLLSKCWCFNNDSKIHENIFSSPFRENTIDSQRQIHEGFIISGDSVFVVPTEWQLTRVCHMSACFGLRSGICIPSRDAKAST